MEYLTKKIEKIMGTDLFMYEQASMEMSNLGSLAVLKHLTEKESRICGNLSPQVSPINNQPQSTTPMATDQPQSRFQRDFTPEQQRKLYEAMKIGIFISDFLDFIFFCEVLENEYR
jgi:hypothetical protein